MFIKLSSGKCCHSNKILTRLPPRDSSLDGRWTRRPFDLSRVHPLFSSRQLCYRLKLPHCHPWNAQYNPLSLPAKLRVKASSYIAQYPVLRTVQSAFTLYFPDRPVHSDTISASLGGIQTYATINVRRLLMHISTTVYSQVLILSPTGSVYVRPWHRAASAALHWHAGDGEDPSVGLQLSPHIRRVHPALQDPATRGPTEFTRRHRPLPVRPRSQPGELPDRQNQGMENLVNKT